MEPEETGYLYPEGYCPECGEITRTIADPDNPVDLCGVCWRAKWEA